MAGSFHLKTGEHPPLPRDLGTRGVHCLNIRQQHLVEFPFSGERRAAIELHPSRLTRFGDEISLALPLEYEGIGEVIRPLQNRPRPVHYSATIDLYYREMALPGLGGQLLKKDVVLAVSLQRKWI